MGCDHLLALAGKWWPARQCFVEDASQRVDVYSRGGLLVAESFGGHIGKAAHLITRHRQMGIAAGFGDTEVHQIREIVWGNDDVLRLYVAVDQSLSVRGV